MLKYLKIMIMNRPRLIAIIVNLLYFRGMHRQEVFKRTLHYTTVTF